MSQAGLALSEFQRDLSRAKDLLTLIKEFRKFAASQVPDGESEWHEAQSLIGIAPHVRTDLPVLAGSLLLYICGRFEYFIREVIIALADELASQVQTFDELPERIRKEYKSKTLDVAQNHRRYGYTADQAEQLIVALATNLDSRSSGSVNIESKVLSISETNMNPSALADIFRRVDLKDIWTEIGKQAQLKYFLSKPSDQDCTNEAKARLDEAMKERNRIAHPSGTQSFPDPDRVLDLAEFFGVLSKIIVDVALIPR